MPRKNKSKKEIVNNIKEVQEADRKRKLVREVIFPFMLELNDNIGFTKVFMQTAATTLESTFNARQRNVKVGDVLPEIKEILSYKDKKVDAELQKYIRLFELLKDETVFDFLTLIQTMPRVIEQYFTRETDKHPIIDVDINKILG